MLFFTFIQPYIDYGLLIWGCATASNLKPIQSKLKEETRNISFKKKRHPAEPLFKQHKILNFEKQRTPASACFIWRITNKEASSTNKKVYGNKNLKFYIHSARSNLLKKNHISGAKALEFNHC